jgi:uncharacterized membrane protein YedE/YeeE
MRQVLASLVAGALFGGGLVVAQMTDPLKVQAFLDIAGDWDPSLAFVMAAAIPVAAIGVAYGRRRQRPLLAPRFDQPPSKTINRKLMTGAALFGAGWGLVGYCPGPALASLGNGSWQTAVFVLSMLVGMAAFRWVPTAAWFSPVHPPEPSPPPSPRS